MRLGKAFQVKISVNNYFLILLLIYALLGILSETLLIFGAVLFHELSHVFVSKAYGIKVSQVEIMPFGGVAKTEDLIETDPSVETMVALAGPLSNCFLIFLALILTRYQIWDFGLSRFFIQINAALAVFNILPILPLDGGRIVRAKLSQKVGFRKSTEMLAKFSRVFAVGLGTVSFLCIFYHVYSISLFIIAIFVYFTAKRESTMAVYIAMRQIARKKEEMIKTGIMPSETIAVQEQTMLRELVKYFIPKKYLIAWVIGSNWKAIGTLTETEILEGLLEFGVNVRVGKVIRQ